MPTPAVRVARATQASSPSSGLVALAQHEVELPFLPGEVIAGKYQVLRLIGSGGMGYVVSATHVELGEVVALKFLRPEALAIPELVERFAREARAAAKIRSEHVARVFDVGALPDGVPFIVMEYLEGQDLCDFVRERGPLPIKVAVEYVMQACEALAAAHAAGVVHRDIKPENLFLTRHAQGLDFIKILDFGISKVALAPGKRAFVRTQLPLGSPVYMSPEQIRSSAHVDARTDIWSLGCVLFELLTGAVAFDEPSLMQLSAAILEQDPVPLRELLPEAPVELEDVVLRCLEKDADKRYGNIAELAIALYRFAPRRSRISAERCYHALKNAGIDCPEFEIKSEFPPGMGDMPASSGNMAVSSVMPSTRARTVSPSVVQRRISGSTTVSLDEAVELRPARKYKGTLLALLGVAAAALAFFVFRGHTLVSSPVSRTGQATANGAQTGTLAQTNAVHTDKAQSPAASADRAAEPSASGSASAHANSAGSVHASSGHRAPVMAKSVVAGPHHHAGDDELDVGY